jgi:metallophosphoesterase superfamily enzyme
MREYAPRIRLSDEEYDIIMNRRKTDGGNRNLVVGDLHAPFILEGYLDFCLKIYEKHNCNKVIFIGDIIDNHFSSYHETDADGMGAGDELDDAREMIRVWHDTFPNAKVCFGNHDLIIARKAQTSGLSKQWVKSIKDVLETPTWTYDEEFYIDNVMYCHGTAKKAKGRAKSELISVVQGHYHSESYVEHLVGKYNHIWAMQVGCGVDKETYAMAYGKHFAKQHINVGVVLEDGTLPFLEYMDLI